MALRSWQADLLLLLVTAIWGWTFPVVESATRWVHVFPFLALRFDLAAAVLAVLVWPRLRRAPAATWGAGALVGLFLFGGYALQTFGMGLNRSPAKTGFITGLSVVLVPVLSRIWLRRPVAVQAWAGVALSTAGLALMTLNGRLAPHAGDLLVLGSALAFALHVTAVARYAGAHDPAALAAIQVGTAALAAHASAVLTGTWRPLSTVDAAVWQAIVITGLLATALAFWLQNTLQPFTTPTHTALIFAAEPVWAAAFAWLLSGETLTGRAYVGGALIVLGMILAELSSLLKRKPASRGEAREAARQSTL